MLTFQFNWKKYLVFLAISMITALLIWQGITASGNPDPTAKHISPTVAAVDTGILVFREGLEAILVLAAITASLTKSLTSYWKPIAGGAGLSFVASCMTWFAVVGIISAVNVPELDIQAATGLLAIVVLLIIMNWFFHKIYWSGWINHHNRRKRNILSSAESNPSLAYKGLMMLGFTAVYREGFEVVLFLQNLRLEAGGRTILIGAAIGLILTVIVGTLTFIAHQKLPYKKMLILTGGMLAIVLIVMVGESVQEMQQAGWIPLSSISLHFPDWIGLWFAVFPTIQSLIAQAIAVILVVGSYAAARFKVMEQAKSKFKA